MGRADLTNEQWVRLVPLLPTGKKLHASFAKLSLGPCRGGCPCCWHGGWHRIAIAAIVDQGQVLADVGQEHSLTSHQGPVTRADAGVSHGVSRRRLVARPR